jgi:hypothetical protein
LTYENGVIPQVKSGTFNRNFAATKQPLRTTAMASGCRKPKKFGWHQPVSDGRHHRPYFSKMNVSIGATANSVVPRESTYKFAICLLHCRPLQPVIDWQLCGDYFVKVGILSNKSPGEHTQNRFGRLQNLGCSKGIGNYKHTGLG